MDVGNDSGMVTHLNTYILIIGTGGRSVGLTNLPMMSITVNCSTSVPKDFSQKSVFWKRILGPKNEKKLISLKVKKIQKS